MRVMIFIAAALLGLGGCNKKKADSAGSGSAAANATGARGKCSKLAMAGTKVLDGVSLEKSTSQEALLASAGLYAGKKVRIEGPIVGICQGVGCWAAVKGPSGKHLNLKVRDGVVDFRTLSKVGYYAVGEGVFTPTGHHGAQIKISGAMITKTACR